MANPVKVNGKKHTQIKKLIEMTRDTHNEIYIALYDKKQDKVVQFTSNNTEFGLDQVARLLSN